MQEETLIRCIGPDCGRMLAHRVNFCPYCGAAQHAGAVRAPLAGPDDASEAASGTVQAAAAPAVASDPAPAAVPQAAPAGRQAAAPAAAQPGPAASAAPPPARTAVPAAPRREPVRLRWWLLALALLWAVWLLANPAKRRIEGQMDKAMALAVECKAREAQAELIALRKTRATPEQLQRVQKALNEAGAACTRKRQRDKAWSEAKVAVEAALATSSVDRARQRLRAFTRRWGEDEATRAMKEAIDARQPEHQRADDAQ